MSSVPKQQEFDLPMYSWYPGWAKRYFVNRALTNLTPN